MMAEGFPGGSVLKNLPANAGDLGLIHDPGIPYMLQGNQAHVLQLRKPTHPTAHAPQQKKPLQWEAHALQLE